MTDVAPAVVRSLEDLLDLKGEPLGPGRSISVPQDRIDRFADVTGDHQWIHVDVDRAADGPFGVTIAHGYLTLSLLPDLARGLVGFEGFTAVVNYGLDRVRFPKPVRVGAHLSATAEVISAEETERGIRAVIRYTVRVDGSGDTACVADAVTLLVGGTR